ncbi:MAG: hypothetical protein ACRDPW_06245 [Mycobacteriales bacterium]
MTNPRRVRKRYPKMPDVTVNDIDQLPAIPRTAGTADDPADRTEQPAAGTNSNDETNKGRERRFTTRAGEVVASIAIWQPNANGVVTKYYDTRIRYVTDNGRQVLKIVVPAIDSLPPGTRVEVEEQTANGRIRVHRTKAPPAKGVSWKKPDVRGALIALTIIVAITVLIGAIGYLIGRSKQPSQEPPAPPGVTIQPNGQPVPQSPTQQSPPVG